MDAKAYLLRVLSMQPVPACCQHPSILGIGFQIEDYSNLVEITEISHMVSNESFGSESKCRFADSPLSLAFTGRCPVCGHKEFTALNDRSRMQGLASDMYHEIVNEFSEWAMYRYVFPEFYLIRGTNKGRLHLDHIYPVSLGFAESVPEFMIGSPVNCRMTTKEKNLTKRNIPHQTLEELINRFEAFSELFSEWSAVKDHYFEFGTIAGSPKPNQAFRDTALAKELLDEGSQAEIEQILAETAEAKLRNPKRKSSPGIVVKCRPDFRNENKIHGPPDRSE